MAATDLAGLESLAWRCLKALARRPDSRLGIDILDALLTEYNKRRTPSPPGPIWQQTESLLKARRPQEAPGPARQHRGQNIDDIINILQARLRREKQPELRYRLFGKLIEVTGKNLGDKQAAFTAAIRAVREFSADDDLLQKLEHLARETRSLDRLERVYREILANGPPRPTGLVILRRLARHYRARGDRARLMTTLMQLALVEPAAGRRKHLLGELDSLPEPAGEPPDYTLALLACCRMAREQPLDPFLRGLLERLAHRAGFLEELALARRTISFSGPSV